MADQSDGTDSAALEGQAALDNAIAAIDRRGGPGYAAAHPELIGSFMIAVAITEHARRAGRGDNAKPRIEQPGKKSTNPKAMSLREPLPPLPPAEDEEPYMIVYCLPPIDFWAGWQKPEDVFTSEDEYGDSHARAEWWPLLGKAEELAYSIGWEGNVRDKDGGPYVSVLPGEGGILSLVVIAWKQENNGTTFVASPYRLPWLEAHAFNFIEG